MCSRKSSVNWRTDWETQYPGFIRANVPCVWGQLECETISSDDFLAKTLNSRQIGYEISQIIIESFNLKPWLPIQCWKVILARF